jgi:hypothetical protein
MDPSPHAEYRMVTEQGWDTVLPLDADSDAGAVLLGRTLAGHPDDRPLHPGLRTTHRVERLDGPGWRVLYAWMPRL